MPQLGSVSGMAENAFTVSGKKNECSMASARSNCFCASAEHDVLKSTRPSFSGVVVRGSASAHTDPTRTSDATSAVTEFTTHLMTTLPVGDDFQVSLDVRRNSSAHGAGSSHSRMRVDGRATRREALGPSRRRRGRYGTEIVRPSPELEIVKVPSAFEV